MRPPVDILAAFRRYYENLYSSRIGGWEEDLNQYLAQVSLPSLSKDSKQLLEQPLTIEELKQALQLAPNEKAPGLDGLLAEFYRIHKDVLLPHLLSVF